MVTLQLTAAQAAVVQYGLYGLIGPRANLGSPVQYPREAAVPETEDAEALFTEVASAIATDPDSSQLQSVPTQDGKVLYAAPVGE